MSNPLKPPLSLLCKLGSLLVHLDEATGKRGHGFDVIAYKAITNDAEVREWLMQMDKLALLPKKR